QERPDRAESIGAPGVAGEYHQRLSVSLATREAHATPTIACASRSIDSPKELLMKGRVLAHHLIWTGYGHWLPNDPRGSGSMSIFKEELRPLGAIHFGRKTIQPRRSNVQEFYAKADELLAPPRISFTGDMIQVIATAFGETS